MRVNPVWTTGRGIERDTPHNLNQALQITKPQCSSITSIKVTNYFPNCLCENISWSIITNCFTFRLAENSLQIFSLFHLLLWCNFVGSLLLISLFYSYCALQSVNRVSNSLQHSCQLRRISSVLNLVQISLPTNLVVCWGIQN